MNAYQDLKRRKLVLIGISFLGLTTLAAAAVVISAMEVGDDVVVAYSGSIDMTGMTTAGTRPSAVRGINGTYNTNGTLANHGSGAILYVIPGTVTATGQIGTQGYLGASSVSGDAFAINSVAAQGPQGIVLPVGYVSGAEFSGSMTFANQDLATMGLNLGLPSTRFTWEHDSITFSAVPEASRLAIYAGCLALGAVVIRRRIKYFEIA